MRTVSILDDVRFWSQVIEDDRRTLICRPELAGPVRAKLNELGLAGLNEVIESPLAPDGQIIVMDHNAINASTAQAIQAATKWRLSR